MDSIVFNNRVVRKSLNHLTETQRTLLETVTQQLIETGLKTPCTELDPISNSILFPYISGKTGQETLLDTFHLQDCHDWHIISDFLFKKLLTPLVTIHQSDLSEVSIPIYNPWLRVKPILGNTESKIIDQIQEMYLKLQTMDDRVNFNYSPSRSLVHGHFHAGQIILEETSQVSWLINLDDLALGCPEIDVGNFIAHLASSHFDTLSTLETDLLYLINRLQIIYQELSGCRLDFERTLFYTAAALLRRALELNQLNQNHVRVMQILQIIEIQLTALQRCRSRYH